MKKTILIALSSTILYTCEQKTSSTSNEVNDTEVRSLLPQLQNNLDAHGGLELWKSFGSLYFERPSDKGIIKHTIDLQNRNERINLDSAYTVGYLTEKSWILPDSTAFTNVRFYKNLYFYFFALPFVAADEGANQESLGQKLFNGTSYDLVKITFGENVGDAPDDQYILYINSETKKLSMINYSVTYFDNTRGEKYSAIIYDDWQKINGLMVPASFSGYKWENDTLGDLRYEASFQNVFFGKNRPDPLTFQIPEGAFVQ